MHAPRSAQLVTFASLGGASQNPSATAMLQGGGNRDLNAERAVTRTASLVFHPDTVPGLEAELTWFRIGYRDRVVQPITNWTRPLADPTYAPFIEHSPTAATLSDLLASVQNFFNTSGLAYDPANVEAILRSGYTNVAEQNIAGLDLSGTYTMSAAGGRLSLRGAVSWLNSTQTTSALAPEFEVAGTLFSPARVNGRLGAAWNGDALALSVFGNYRSGVTDTAVGRKTASFTTFDTTVRYALKHQTGPLSGVELSVSAQNLLNRQPPLHMPGSRDQAPYDSTNYSALGRFLSASLSWHF
jgi:outer membrane receptor for ferrienterochelin and colicin